MLACTVRRVMWEKLTPLVAFQGCLHPGSAPLEEASQIAGEKCLFCQLAAWAARGFELKEVRRQRPAGPSLPWLEVMIMVHAPKWSLELGITEGVWRLPCRDGAGQLKPQAEMAGSPGDLFSLPDEAGLDPRDGRLAGGQRREDVEIDASGKVEAPGRRSMDSGDKVDDCQAPSGCGLTPCA